MLLGIKFFACPWHWGVNFNYSLKSTAPASTCSRFNDIPENIDVLITHGPAHGRLDRTLEGETWGSRELFDAVKRVKPLVHLHGHLTESRGFIPAFGHLPLTLNSACCERTRHVMYACPQVVKCTQILNANDLLASNNNSPIVNTNAINSSSKSSNSVWEFSIDFL